MISRYAFFFTSPGADPLRDRVSVETGGVRNVLVPVPETSAVPDLARRAVAEGIQVVELCGDFDAGALAAVIAAVGPDVPVGAVRYGPEAIAPLAKLTP